MTVDQGDRHVGFDQKLGAAFHTLVENEARVAHFNHFGARGKQLVEPRRQVKLHVDAVDHHEDAVPLDEGREVDAGLVQQLGAGALHECQVLAVEHDAPRIGVLVIDPNGDFQASESRSLTAAGATMPKWRYAVSVAMRPRGVRCR